MDFAGVQLGKVPARTGTARGLVVNVLDPLRQGRVEVQIPSMRVTAWAKVAGAAGGATFAPEVGDEVTVAFEGGDARAPVVTGGLWNGSDKPPTSAGSVSGLHPKLMTGMRGRKP